ncbi:hypothetical protein S7711_10945 [Stachybotrys chartarum IBT 7711]|uniref:Uncharacterized protein n=1 Tax=Stachybotrys chartarum (strain CBS 109288 / IBT 7711) TaxID=1280523 RepID=A0A084AHG4_STACB|nr:hypothetical protein S7711_10945 [Stachybotrys chartarum IBT 7711]KFA79158.1 hypothetical protein S40288_11051 [Stachybotrys chartarum IBT 40288]
MRSRIRFKGRVSSTRRRSGNAPGLSQGTAALGEAVLLIQGEAAVGSGPLPAPSPTVRKGVLKVARRRASSNPRGCWAARDTCNERKRFPQATNHGAERGPLIMQTSRWRKRIQATNLATKYLA